MLLAFVPCSMRTHPCCQWWSRPVEGVLELVLDTPGARRARQERRGICWPVHIAVHRVTQKFTVFLGEMLRVPYLFGRAQDRTATRTEADLRAAQMLQPTNGQRHARRNLGDTAAGWACSQNAWRRLAHVQELPNCVRQRYDLRWRCTLRLHALDSRCACAWTLVEQIRT